MNTAIGVSIFLNLLFVTAASAGDILCERKPTAYLVGEIKSKSSDPCAASAKIQAIAYECGDATDNFNFVQDALESNLKKAEKKCIEYCEKIGPKCTGYLDKPAACGLKTPGNRVIEVGRTIIHCPKHCKGEAFNYCSIYHGNFFSTSPALFKAVKENCHCRKE